MYGSRPTLRQTSGAMGNEAQELVVLDLDGRKGVMDDRPMGPSFSSRPFRSFSDTVQRSASRFQHTVHPLTKAYNLALSSAAPLAGSRRRESGVGSRLGTRPGDWLNRNHEFGRVVSS